MQLKVGPAGESASKESSEAEGIINKVFVAAHSAFRSAPTPQCMRGTKAGCGWVNFVWAQNPVSQSFSSRGGRLRLYPTTAMILMLSCQTVIVMLDLVFAPWTESVRFHVF